MSAEISQRRSSVAPYEAEQITFYTQAGRLHGHVALPQWLFAELGRQGFKGATMTGGLVGEGHDGIIHTVTWLDDVEQPVQITAVAASAQIDHLLASLEQHHLGVFYIRLPVTAGVI